MVDKLKGKVAVITGSSDGIGKATALAMAKEGAKVVVNGIISEKAEAVVKEITDLGGQAIALVGDVSKFETGRQLIQAAKDNFGRIDILHNNAGIIRPNTPWDMTEEEWDSVINVHLKSSFNCIRHASGLMIEQRWGRIINASGEAWFGFPDMLNYSTAKAGMVGLTRSVALAVGKYGVTCNAYCPLALTDMTRPTERRKRLVKERDEAGVYPTRERMLESLYPPLPETVPPFIIYLCTDEAANINGQVFRIKGGHIAIYSRAVEENPIDKPKEDGLWTVEELIEAVPKVWLKDILTEGKKG